MFTGIIEAIGNVESVIHVNSNIDFTISCPFTDELKVDQSLSHNGCCLTVVAIEGRTYKVTAIRETLEVSNLKNIKVGDSINLERCVTLGSRLDGHIVQGHVDQTGELYDIEAQDGSYLIRFKYEDKGFTTIRKGSITVNGISLTVVDSGKGDFSVAVIPYTWENTNMKNLKIGDMVNLEFDLIGKYITSLMNK